MEKKLDEAEGAVEAYDLGRDGKTLAEEISELAAESAIEDELAAMKARLEAQQGKKSKDGGTTDAS